ncbi:uncharacterized protein LOC135099816 [Scylla paramamosain]|uniref:uncharacterized protein LOC135099816 n=1 Tax=Scylla paramamosain TaxID=85552 RepID=UPI0030837DDD
MRTISRQQHQNITQILPLQRPSPCKDPVPAKTLPLLRPCLPAEVLFLHKSCRSVQALITCTVPAVLQRPSDLTHAQPTMLWYCSCSRLLHPSHVALTTQQSL